jgi:hypothetical protein
MGHETKGILQQKGTTYQEAVSVREVIPNHTARNANTRQLKGGGGGHLMGNCILTWTIVLRHVISKRRASSMDSLQLYAQKDLKQITIGYRQLSKLYFTTVNSLISWDHSV